MKKPKSVAEDTTVARLLGTVISQPGFQRKIKGICISC